MLQERGYYTIELSDGKKIPLRFCTWTFKRFSELNGDMSLGKIMEIFEEISIKHLVSLLLCAAEYTAIKNKETFSYSEMDASDWIDDMGGIAGTKFLAMIEGIAKSISDKPSENGEQTEEEKKSLVT